MIFRCVRPLLILAVFGVFAVACSDLSEESATADASDTRFDSPITAQTWPQLEPQPRDEAIEARIDALLNGMTLEQKVGQVIQADNTAITPEDVRQYRIGSVLSGGNSAPGGKPYATASEWVAAADAYYAASMDVPDGETPIPVFWGIDAVHGHNNVIGGTIFSHNIGLGAARDVDLIERIAAATAIELRVTGHDWTFAPTLAVPQDDRWGRTYEGFSEDPALVAEYATAMVEGLQGKHGTEGFLGADKVIATAKHFVGDGGTAEGRDQGDAQISERELNETHAAGYPPAIEAGVQAVMASFSSWNGRKVHGDRGLLTDVLRGRLQFDGFVVGDWNAHGQIETCTNENCSIAFNAGIDMFMAPDSWRGIYENTLAQVKSGEISAARLDEAVRRILRVKLRAGLFSAGPPSTRPYAGQEQYLGSDAHRALAREAVRKSLVLLKNNHGVLPLDASKRILVAGDGADSFSKQSGGWTLTWQGGAPNELFPKGQTILDGVREIVGAAGGEVLFSESGAYDDKPDAAIVVFGEEPYAEFQGDKENLAYQSPESRDLELLRALKNDGVPVVAVFLSGRPLWVNPHINAADAFVAAWLPGTEGGGVADVLFGAADRSGRHDFEGRLSFSWPKRADDYDINVVNGEQEPLFAYGYGLTYGDDGHLPALSEEPGVDLSRSLTAKIFADGRPQGAYRLFGGPDLQSATPLSLPRDEAPPVAISGADLHAQEDAMVVALSDAGVFFIGVEEAVDLQRETNAQMELTVALQLSDTAPSENQRIEIGMACLHASQPCAGYVDVSERFSDIPAAAVTELNVPLSCFASAGANMRSVDAPFILRSNAALSVLISEIRLSQDSNTAQDCP